ncbi:MAG TPA: NUDIX domain-containing protein [Verrucomicrobiae bacterium]|nr:NUDIX domain-containing protein [Verrucomicrobiae bacterium]
MIVPVVNRDDVIIGAKDRSALDFKKDIFRTASLWITNSQGDVLLAQRKHNKKVDPGKWAEAVGGTVEGGDSYETTIYREAQEELGIVDVPFQLGPKQLITFPARYFVQWYSVTLDWPLERFMIQTAEIEQIAWLPRAQLETELKTAPGKYIAAMPDIIALFPS